MLIDKAFSVMAKQNRGETAQRIIKLVRDLKKRLIPSQKGAVKYGK